MDPSEAQSHLLDVLSSHQIPLASDDVSWAFGNPKTSMPVVDWVERYLGKDTLVSLEEAEIYNHLKKTGNLPKLQKQHTELHLVHPRFEESLHAETEELKASTQMLKQQTAQLKKQKANLKAMRERGNTEKEKKRKLEERRRKKWQSEKENIQAAIDDLLGILREEVADFKQSTKTSEIDFGGVEKMLDSDDRVLGRLGRLADGVIVSGGDGGTAEDEVVERVTLLVKKLATLSAAALKAQLDRMFLEIVAPETNYDATHGNPDAGAIAELKQDLESLYSEIPSVAQMAAEQEYLRPVLKEVENGRRKTDEGLRVGGTYICDVLLHLQKRNASAAEKLKRELAKARAIAQIIATIEQESKSPLRKQEESQSASSDQKVENSTRPRTPVKHPQPFRNMPIFTPPNRRRGASLDIARGEPKNGDEEFPELRMLTLLGVPVPSIPTQNASALFASPLKSGSATPPRFTPELPASNYKYLDVQVQQQSEKLQNQEQDISGETEIREAIDSFWNVTRVAEDALIGANIFPPLSRQRGAMSFVGEEQIEGLEEIERIVNSVAGRMGGLSRGLEELERTGGDLQGLGREKRAFVDRWGRH